MFHPFQLELVTPPISDDLPWQDWILLSGAYDNALGSFIHGPPRMVMTIDDDECIGNYSTYFGSR